MKLKSLAVFAISCFSASVLAADSNIDPEAKAQGNPQIASLSLARQLAGVGMAEKDPLILMTAAKIYKMTPTEEKERSKETEGGQDSTKDKAMVFNAESMLAYAKEYAGDNKTYLTMISDIESIKYRGRTLGPARTSSDVNAHSSDTYRITYNGGELAEILIVGDGDTDLDLYVYDKDGNQVCKDIDTTDTMYCSWTPRRTGKFRIKIKNLGDVYNAYDFITN